MALVPGLVSDPPATDAQQALLNDLDGLITRKGMTSRTLKALQRLMEAIRLVHEEGDRAKLASKISN